MHTVGHELSPRVGGVLGRGGRYDGHIMGGKRSRWEEGAVWWAWVAGKCPVARAWIRLGGYQVVMVGIVLCWISLLQVRRASGHDGHGGW